MKKHLIFLSFLLLSFYAESSGKVSSGSKEEELILDPIEGILAGDYDEFDVGDYNSTVSILESLVSELTPRKALRVLRGGIYAELIAEYGSLPEQITRTMIYEAINRLTEAENALRGKFFYTTYLLAYDLLHYFLPGEEIKYTPIDLDHLKDRHIPRKGEDFSAKKKIFSVRKDWTIVKQSRRNSQDRTFWYDEQKGILGLEEALKLIASSYVFGSMSEFDRFGWRRRGNKTLILRHGNRYSLIAMKTKVPFIKTAFPLAIIPYTEEKEVVFATSQFGRNSPQYQQDKTEKSHKVEIPDREDLVSFAEDNREVPIIQDHRGNWIALGLLEIELANVQKALKKAALANKLANFHLELKENGFSEAAKIKYTHEIYSLNRLLESLEKARRIIIKKPLHDKKYSLKMRKKNLNDYLNNLKPEEDPQQREKSRKGQMMTLKDEITAKEKRLRSLISRTKEPLSRSSYSRLIQLFKETIEEIKALEELLLLLESQPSYLEEREQEKKKKRFETLKGQLESEVEFLEEALEGKKTEEEISSREKGTKKKIMRLYWIVGVEETQKVKFDPVVKNYLDKVRELFGEEIIALALKEFSEKKNKKLEEKEEKFRKIKESLDSERELLKEAFTEMPKEYKLTAMRNKTRIFLATMNSIQERLKELDRLPAYIETAKKFLEKGIHDLNEKKRLEEESIPQREEYLEELKERLRELEEGILPQKGIKKRKNKIIETEKELRELEEKFKRTQENIKALEEEIKRLIAQKEKPKKKSASAADEKELNSNAPEWGPSKKELNSDAPEWSPSKKGLNQEPPEWKP